MASEWMVAVLPASQMPGLKIFFNYMDFDMEIYDDVIKWKHFPPYWPFVRGIHRSPVNSPHKGQSCGALMSSMICAWTDGWVNNRDVGDLRRSLSRHFNVLDDPGPCLI